ncbi:methyltransferase domain-containing protein [Chitinispirillales bacterium ANBcel5]|uniref:methyltransferase domain-containing protein n=1 Tax=Cellulosispirillum alkaliphilum TaxID=3039283 RepID=UPI002A52A6F5|nr:methyltransferase domain-containing protein [Chitinispirillales bacterium ANBcel5]
MNSIVRDQLLSRSQEPEIMDSKSCDTKQLIKTLQQFKLVNLLFSRVRYLLKQSVLSDLEKVKEASLLDMGCGGCDISLWLIRRCREKGLRCNITCVDYDPRIVSFGKHLCKDYPEIDFIISDLTQVLKANKYDYVVANHVLHHFSDDELQTLIPLIFTASKRLFLLNDLYRSAISYYLFPLLSKPFFHNSFICEDGKRSIKRGFLKEEIDKLVDPFNATWNIKTSTIFPGHLYCIGEREN